MAYDPGSDRVVLFGGCAVVLAVCLDDTWAYEVDAATWSAMGPATAPSARSFHAMAYDPRLDAVVLFGGHQGQSAAASLPSSETWMYQSSANQWTRLETAQTPPARAYPRLAYAPEVGRLFLFGGSGDGQQFGDLWYLDAKNQTWVEVAAPGGPAPRAWHAMAYSPPGRALVVFGGGEEGGNFRLYTDETWLFGVREARWHSPDRR